MSISEKLKEHIAAKRIAVQTKLDNDKKGDIRPALMVEEEWLDFLDECVKAVEGNVHSAELAQRLKEHVDVTVQSTKAALKAAEGTFKEQLLKADAIWLNVLDEVSSLLQKPAESEAVPAAEPVAEPEVASVEEVVEETEKPKPKPRTPKTKTEEVAEESAEKPKPKPRTPKPKATDDQDNS